MQFRVLSHNLNSFSQSCSECEIHMFYGLAMGQGDKLQILYNLLSEKEQKRARLFRFESDYNNYVTAHALLRKTIGERLNADPALLIMEESENGKPFLPGMELSFNLSRTKKCFAFAIAPADFTIGIDIEQIHSRANYLNIARSYYNAKEQVFIESFSSATDKTRAFFELWTRKEALLKALGLGLNTDLKNVVVTEGENIIKIEKASVIADAFSIYTVLCDDSLISIASSGPVDPGIISFNFATF